MVNEYHSSVGFRWERAYVWQTYEISKVVIKPVSEWSLLKKEPGNIVKKAR